MTNTNAEHPAPETAPEFVERLKRPTRPDDSCKAVIDELQATSAFLCDFGDLSHPAVPSRRRGWRAAFRENFAQFCPNQRWCGRGIAHGPAIAGDAFAIARPLPLARSRPLALFWTWPSASYSSRASLVSGAPVGL